MTTLTTSVVYLKILEDVIDKVRDEFVANAGPGEGVLQELQKTWELKMIQAGVVLPPSERPRTVMKPTAVGAATTTPFHDLNVPYEGTGGTGEYETPTAEMLFPPTPLQTPLPGTADSSMYNIPTGFSDHPTPMSNDAGDAHVDIKPVVGRHSPYMPPPSLWMNQRPALGVDVNEAYVEGQEEVDRGSSQLATQDLLTEPNGKRKRDEFPAQFRSSGYIPQQDGAGDAANDIFEMEITQSKPCGRGVIVNLASAPQNGSSWRIPQLDGPVPNPYEDMLSTPNIYTYQGVVNEDYNVVNTPAPIDLQAATPAPPLAQNDVKDEIDDDEPPLNENDDDDDDDEFDDIDKVEELNTQHLVLAQFDKVTRTKSRWKCTLKDGIMHINNKDMLFNKASGEFEF